MHQMRYIQTMLWNSKTVALYGIYLNLEMSTTNISRDNGRPARKADDLTAIYEPIV
jgi:hypothetical protein